MSSPLAESKQLPSVPASSLIEDQPPPGAFVLDADDTSSNAGSTAEDQPASLSATPLRPLSEIREPELFIQGLNSASLFDTLPTDDPIASLLSKQFPVHSRPFRDLSGNWRNSSVAEMKRTRSWRALANYAQDHICACQAEATSKLLNVRH